MERQAKDGTFYRKVGPDEWEPVTRTAKDGTVFKKVGADEWKPLSDNAKTQVENDKILGIPVTTIEGALDALPFAGALAGGVIGLPAGGLIGAAGGAGLGAAGGEAAANAIRAGLGLESAPQTRQEMILDPIKEGLAGAAGEGAGQIISKVPVLVKSGVKAARSLPAAARSGVRNADEIIPAQSFDEIGLNTVLRPDAGEIRAATERIAGVEPTPGMLTANENLQNIESVLRQTPTVAGEKVRRSYDPIRKGLQQSSEELVGAPSLSPFAAGEEFKAGLTQKIQEKVKPLSSQFEEIRASAKHIKPSQESLHRSANRLLKQDLAEFKDLPQGQAIRKYADMIRNAKSLDSLKQLRSSVGDELSKAMDAGDGQLAMALGKVKGAIQRLERREILKSAIEASPTRKQGEAAAKELINEIKEVNKGWRALMSELETIAKAGGIKKISSPKHLARIIEDMPSEKIAERFFNTKNFKGLRDIKTHLPEEFEVLRQNKLGMIAQKSMTKGELDPVKLVRNLKAIGPEARQLLFGQRGEQMLSDMETVLNAMPSKVGASDTPRGMAWFSSVLNPTQWGAEAQSAYSYMRLKGKIAKGSSSSRTPKMLPRAAGYLAVSQASTDGARQKGPDKWASQGFEKLSAHTGGRGLKFSQGEMMADPRLKSLLIQASDLKPGTKAMDGILRKIEQRRAEGNN